MLNDYRPAFFNPEAHGNLLLPTRVINATVRDDAVDMARVIDVFRPRPDMHIVSARLVEVDGGVEPVHVLLKFTGVVSPRVQHAIKVCVDAKDFLASTDELDGAVAILKEFGMCTVGLNDAVPEKTYISRNEKGCDHKWDICTDGAMLLQVYNNDPSRSFCTRVYISKRCECCYDVHVVLKKTETIMRTGFAAGNVLAMEEVRKRFLATKCTGAAGGDPVKLSQDIVKQAADRLAAVVAERQARTARVADHVEALARERRDDEVFRAAGGK